MSGKVGRGRISKWVGRGRHEHGVMVVVVGKERVGGGGKCRSRSRP
jgi:hypothetical protein